MVSIGFLVVISVHGPMGPVVPLGKVSPRDLVHVSGQRPHHECGWERHDSRAKQILSDTQHEHNGPTSCHADNSLEDASPITVSDERLAAHAPVDAVRVVQSIELLHIDRVRWLQEEPKESTFV